MFRLLKRHDGEQYYCLVHDAYRADGEMGIDFPAVDLPDSAIIVGLDTNPTYGLFEDGRLVSSIALRMPWGPNPGPYGVPHLGWVSTRPEWQQKGYAAKLFRILEERVLLETLKVPAVSLGTAAEHPWLVHMYESWGFHVVENRRLGQNRHTTTYMKKNYLTSK